MDEQNEIQEEELREPKVTIGIGKKGIGKTHTTKKVIEKYAMGDPSRGIRPRRVLIFDVNNEYTNYKSISLSHVKAFSYHPKIEIRRVLPVRDNGQKMGMNDLQTALSYILDNFSNGLLLIEDITRYVGDSYKKDIIGMLVTNRHINCDVIIHFQFKGKAAHPKIISTMNFIRLHETSDEFEMHKDNFKGHLEVLKIAEALVTLKNKDLPKGKHWFYCYIDTDYSEIIGDFTVGDFRQAICNYIDDNYQKLIRPMLQRRDRQGNLLYTHENAYNELEKELVNKYWGN